MARSLSWISNAPCGSAPARSTPKPFEEAAYMKRLALALTCALPTLLLAMPAFAEDAPAAKIDSGDTAWMLVSTALVLMMTIPGLALFYAGMVRKKNILATLMQSFAITCLVTVLWFAAGYSLAFLPGT